MAKGDCMNYIFTTIYISHSQAVVGHVIISIKTDTNVPMFKMT
jgi:hypothetical protein